MQVAVGDCFLCGGVSVMELDEATYKRVEAWRRTPRQERPFVQDAFPELTPGQREQLISGSHEKCFDEAFKEED